jgi:hypothetical protein
MHERPDPPPLDIAARAAPSPLRPERRFVALLLPLLVAALALTATARADIVVSHDDQGRAITFDVRAPEVDVEWYAALLRPAGHGDEISNVTIRIVPPEKIGINCGLLAEACYGSPGGGAVIVIPAKQTEHGAHNLVHEYGHHLDHSWAVPGFAEPNGTPAWWTARGMESLYRAGSVAPDYSLGWNRSIGEIFAEDYAFVYRPGEYNIPWLSPPDEALRAVMLGELGGTPSAPAVRSAPTPEPSLRPPPDPVVVVRRGKLAPRAHRTLPFRLTGPGRHVTLTTKVAGAPQAGTRARVELVCDGKRVATRALGRGRSSTTIDVRDLGPAHCEARLDSTSRMAHSYVLRLRLEVEDETATP